MTVYNGNEIAIVGISLRFPGSSTVDEFWDNLVNGVESIKQLCENEVRNISANKNYVRAVSLCEDYDKFDAGFFGYTGKEATLINPQQRLFLETCWNAIEHAGYAPLELGKKRTVGVFGTEAYNTYLIDGLQRDKCFIENNGFHDVMVGNDKDYLTTRVSYKLGLTGPSVTVQTACSSALAAVHYAIQSLLLGECDCCLAGGSSVSVSDLYGYEYKQGFINSRDGHCRPFDEKASGTVFGSGVGVVVLKRLEDAIADNDTVYAVIRSSAINNDGKNKIGFTAPSPKGQEEALSRALMLEDIDPLSISYIEAHGTGTELGDPIEIAAIKKVYGNYNADCNNNCIKCGIGSVKSNLGHLNVASGIAGLIKTVLCLYYKRIVPTINFSKLNSNISLVGTRFYVADKYSDWDEFGSIRRAAVSAFGVGGTNAHIILEEAPIDNRITIDQEKLEIIKISAKTMNSIEQMTKNINKFVNKSPSQLEDIIYTLNCGRNDFEYKRFLLLERLSNNRLQIISSTPIYRLKYNEVTFNVFVFRDSSVCKFERLKEIYSKDLRFQRIIKKCCEYVSSILLYNIEECCNDESQYNFMLKNYPDLFAFMTSYAFAEMLKYYGCTPDRVYGENTTRYVACCVADKLDYKDVLFLLILKQKFHAQHNNEYKKQMSLYLENICYKKSKVKCYNNNADGYTNEYDVQSLDFWINNYDDIYDAEKHYLSEGSEDNDSVLFFHFSSYFSIKRYAKYANTFIENSTKLTDSPKLDYLEAKVKCIGYVWMYNTLPKINWDKIYMRKNRKRVQAPLYIFDRKRYWHSDKEENTYVWLSEWTIAKDIPSNKDFDLVLILGDYKNLAKGIVERLCKTNIRVIQIKINEIIKSNEIQVDEEKLKRILRGIFKINYQSISIINFIPLSFRKIKVLNRKHVESEYYNEYFVNICLCSIFNQYINGRREIKFMTVSTNTYKIRKDDRVNPFTGMLIGPATTIPLEIPNFNMCILDLEEAEDDVLINQIACTCICDGHETHIAYRDGYRYIPKYINGIVKSKEMQIKEGGIYVITGGTGNVGLLCAEQIAKRAKTKIYLLSKSYTNEFMAKTQLSGKEKAILEKIKKIQQYGSSLEIEQVQVENFTKFKSIITFILKKEGVINGVIHAAGMVGNASAFINDMTFAKAKQYFEAKVEGALNLAKILEHQEVDFCMMISSNVATLGGIGDSAYSSANAFLKSLCYSLDKRNYHNWIAIDFDSLPRAFEEEYLFKGIKFGIENINKGANFGKSLFANQLNEEEFTKAFDAILMNLSRKNLIISKTNYIKRLKKSKQMKQKNVEMEYIQLRGDANEKAALADRFAELWSKVIGEEIEDYNDNFFDIGGDSYLAIQLISLINKELQCSLNIKDIFEFPTINLLTKKLLGKRKEVSNNEEKELDFNFKENKDIKDIAVIGMAGRFPGADNVDELWANLLNGKISINHFYEKPDYNNMLLQNNSKYNVYVGARGIINDIDKFDYTFFKLSKTEAEFMDPQQRLFLQCCWEALNDAGYQPDEIEEKVGVFGSTCISSYLICNIVEKGYLKNDPNNLAIVGNSPDALATRVSYKLNFTGPSKSIQSFCSSSLVALQEAINSLRNKECSIAVVGGVNIVIPQNSGYMYNESSIFSKTGEIRPFDNSADGTIFSNGIGVVVLRKYDKAVECKNPIYGVIKEAVVNNDGSNKVGYLSPSIKGHEECIVDTYKKAKINPESITYVEAHATGTRLGDPIEVQAFKNAFQLFTNKKNYCCIGSIKGNIGHLDRASGIVGLIKCLLIVKNRKIPPLPYLNELNDEVILEDSPFYLSKKIIEYKEERPMRVAMSSLGVGGTNAHVVVEEVQNNGEQNNNRAFHIITLSAKTIDSLEASCKDLQKKLNVNCVDSSISQIAYTLQKRKSYRQRCAFVVSSKEELVDKLMSIKKGKMDEKINEILLNISEEMFVRKDLFEYYYETETLFKDVADQLMTSKQEIANSETLKPLFYNTLIKYLKKIIKHRTEIIILFSEEKQKESNKLQITIDTAGKSVLYQILANIWVGGIDVDWNLYNWGNEVSIVNLPPYHFIGETCWLGQDEDNKLETEGGKIIQQIDKLRRELLYQLDNV